MHFLLLGIGLFVLFEFVVSEDAAYDENVIVVDRNTLLTFVQFRARAFEPGAAAAYLDNLEGGDLERLIDDFVREEALYRQAIALGVDANDYVIKRRMIQAKRASADAASAKGRKISRPTLTLTKRTTTSIRS